MALIGRPPKAAKLAKACQQCGKEYEIYAWENRRHKFCSRPCYALSKIGKGKPLIAPEKRKCLNCGLEFLVGGAGNKKKWEKYCTRSCSAKYRWLHRPGHQRAREMSALETAWFAGVFDGEGCIAWPRRDCLMTVRLTVANTNLAFLRQVIKISGTGKLHSRVPRSTRHTQAWMWDCYGENARIILRQILPWLIIKREAAEVALGIREAVEPPWTQRTLTTRNAEKSQAGNRADGAESGL